MGLRNEQDVLKRFKDDANSRFLGQSDGYSITETYRIGLSACPQAAAERMASSPDAVTAILYGSVTSPASVEVKSSVTIPTRISLTELCQIDGGFKYISFSNAALPETIEEIQEELDDLDADNASPSLQILVERLK